MKIISPKRLLTNVFQTVRNGDIFANSSLDLPFARTKTLDSRVTFTRASSGTFVGSDGLIKTATTDAPRFDHNPTTGESLGLLVEEARTNLLTYSEDFGNVIWLYTSASSSTNTTSSPDGATTADTITSAGTAVVSQSIVKTASAITYTASVFVKGSITGLSFTIDDGATINRGRCIFNLSTGTLTSSASEGSFTGTSGSITAYSNNWYKLILTTTTNSSTLIARHRLFWTGVGTSIDVWGAQLEAGAFPTSYIPTTTATVTRAADVASITGSAFTSFYNQAGGTVFSSFRRISYTGTSTVVSINDNTTNNRLYNLRQDTAAALTVISATAGSVDASPSLTLSSGASVDQVAVAQQLNNFGASANGGTVATDSTVLMPTVTQANIGNVTSSSFFNGTIKRLTYWPTRLANTTLQQITQP
jgi:hypothetical protein